MRRFLYISFGNYNTPGRGVTQKIEGQINVFKKQGYNCSFVSGFDNGIVYRDFNGKEVIYKNKGSVRRQICKWCVDHADSFDYTYIRFQFFDPLVLYLLKTFKRKNIKIVMEIPTFPYEDELKIQGLKGVPKIACDRAFRIQCAKYIDKFACPLYNKPIFGVETLQIKNGIDTSRIKIREGKISPTNIRLLAVASMSRWHGFERLIEGMHLFYKAGNADRLIFNIVGDGDELQKYKELTKDYGLEDKIIFWGRQSGQELERAYNESDIGISSLGMHRLNTEISNPLKTVEYLAKGMPVVCEDGEISIAADNPYRLTVPFNDSPIDISEVIRFYYKIYKNGEVNEIIYNIRKECEENCSMYSALKPVVQFFNQN